MRKTKSLLSCVNWLSANTETSSADPSHNPFSQSGRIETEFNVVTLSHARISLKAGTDFRNVSYSYKMNPI